jgi:hypothetical protein
MQRSRALGVPLFIWLVFLLLITGQPVFFSRSYASPAARPFSQLNGSWATPVAISDGSEPDNPDIAVCADGTVHVVWEQDRRIWHNYRAPGGDWQGPTVAFGSGVTELQYPTIAAAISGSECVVHLAWMQDWGATTDIFYARWESGDWQLSQNVSGTEGQSLHPDIAVTSAGEPRIVWAEGGTPWVFLGVPGRSAAPIRGEFVKGDFPSLVIDTEDRAHFTWQRQDTLLDPPDIYYWWEGLELWEVIISGPSDNPSSQPQIIMMAGKPLIIWLEKIGDRREIYASQSTEFGNWEQPVSLCKSCEVKRGSPPAVAASNNGPVHVAWPDKNPDAIAYVTLWPVEGRLALEGLSDPTFISNGGSEAQSPGVAVSLDGSRVYLVWVEADSDGSTRIYFTESEARPHHLYIPLIANQRED